MENKKEWEEKFDFWYMYRTGKNPLDSYFKAERMNTVVAMDFKKAEKEFFKHFKNDIRFHYLLRIKKLI